MIRLRPATMVAVVLGASASLAGAQGAPRTLPLTPGMVITESVRIRPGVYRLPAPASLDSALVVVRGSGVVVDMRGVRLEGTAAEADPDQAAGVAVRIDGGDGVELRGATIRGYRIAVIARGTRRLALRDNDLSHNW